MDSPNPIGFTFLLLFGAARLVISWAPMDEPGAARTRTGSMHNVLATVFFASETVAAFLYGGSFVHDDALGGIAGPSTVLAWCMAVVSAAILATSLAKPLRPYFGLIERLLYVAVITWMITVAVAVINA